MPRSPVLALSVMMILSSAQLWGACDPAVEKQVTAALDTYLGGLNSRDAASWAATLSFPQVRIQVGATPEVWPTPEASAAAFDAAQQFQPGWDHSVWSSVEVLWCAPDAAYARVHYLDIDASDSVQQSLQGVYVLTRRAGRWGVQARFSGLVPAQGELRSDATRGARHGLEEYLAAQEGHSAEALAVSANLPLVTISSGDVAVLSSPAAVGDAVAAAGPDLCGPLPELSETLLAAPAMVIMVGLRPPEPGSAATALPNLYVLTDQDGHWGVTGCAAARGSPPPD